MTEAWSATPPDGWKPGEPLLMAKSEGPHRLEVVIAAAYSRRRRNSAVWRIERDADGRRTDPRAGVDGMTARMLR